jgi:integrase
MLANTLERSCFKLTTVSTEMKQRYRLFRRGWGTYYCEDTQTGKQESLGTRSKQDAQRLVHARNEAERQPLINMQIARAYVSASDPAALTRTWQFVMDEMGKGKKGASTRLRWTRGVAQKPFDLIRNKPLIETRAEHFLDVMATGTVSTNIYLRRLHNFALDMNWLLAPIIPRRKWPVIRFGQKRAITLEEHQKIVAGESNTELRDFYELLWQLGGSQTDMASLCAENIDWANRTITYARMKTGTPVVIRFGDAVAQIVKPRASGGCLFPQIAQWKESDRGKAFIRRCRLVKVEGVSLHSYRYAWAERAKMAGYPERFAQEALGHKSAAVHRAYSRNAQVKIPALEDYERAAGQKKVIAVEFQNGQVPERAAAGTSLDTAP